MERMKKILFSSSEKESSKRENANVNGNSSMGKMLQIGSYYSNKFADKNLLTKTMSKRHNDGDIHIHDRDFLSIGTSTCTQIDLGKQFKHGFNPGHGFIRPPKRIGTMASLSAIIIQSNQNDQHGGQSVDSFDYYLQDGVLNSYQKLLQQKLITLLEYALDIDYGISLKLLEDDTVELTDLTDNKQLIDFVNATKPTTIEEPITYWKTFAKLLEKEFKISETESIHISKKLKKDTIKEANSETFQAMEGLTHNLNTMHCLPASERIWVFNKKENVFGLMSMQEIFNSFETRKYQVISLNQKTGKSEFKDLTHIKKKDNQRKLVKLTTSYGQKVTTTDNHEIMTLDGLNISEELPNNIKSILSPRGIHFPVINNNIDISKYGNIYINTKYKDDLVTINEDLARLMGIYVADGSIIGNNDTLALTVCDKINGLSLSNLVSSGFNGVEFNRTTETYMNSKNEENIKEHRYSVGVRIGKMFKDLCGDNALTKKIPIEILFSTPEIKIAFLKGYFDCDGRRNAKYNDCSSVSKDLIKQINLIILSLSEIPSLNHRLSKGGYQSKNKELFGLILGNKPSNRIGLNREDETKIEIPKYDLSFVREFLPKELQQQLPRRKSNNVNYLELEKIVNNDKSLGMEHLLNFFNVPVKEKENHNSGEEYVYDISVEDNENFLTEDCIFVHNSRAGAQVPFSSLNFGTCTTPEGRMVTKNLLLSHMAGLGKSETPIFPILIFKVKEGINFNPEDINYDLFKLSCRVTAKRLFPNYSFLDAPFNAQYYVNGDFRTEVSYMGCRTRNIANLFGEEIVTGRGNLSFTSINLPRLGILHKDMKDFYKNLDKQINLVIKQLIKRYELQCKLTVKNFPFLMGQGVWIDSDKLGQDDTLESVLKHGSLTVGFIGLAETLIALTGKHHGESAESQKLGLEIIGHMRKRMDEATKKHNLNFALIATPAEGLSSRFTKIDTDRFGVIEGITDKDFYTNSFHVPVYHKIDIRHKLDIEAPYHELTNGGHISYVELDGDVSKNPVVIEQIVRQMHKSGIGYGSINFKVDNCLNCGYGGLMDEECPVCKSKHIRKIRRVTGYLSPLDMFGDGKRAEEKCRITHS